MKISTKGRYALQLLLDLAENRDQGFVPLKDIAERQHISKQYLERIVSLLSASHILRTSRGKQGGYMLAKDPAAYTVGQILRLTEGSLAPVPCLDDASPCDRADQCKTLFLWSGLFQTVNAYLDGITLQDILDRHAEKDASHYVI